MQIKMLELHFPLYITPLCSYCEWIILVHLLDYSELRLITYLQEEEEEEEEEEVLHKTIQVIIWVTTTHRNVLRFTAGAR